VQRNAKSAKKFGETALAEQKCRKIENPPGKTSCEKAKFRFSCADFLIFMFRCIYFSKNISSVFFQ